jgi:hypothetical protein
MRPVPRETQSAEDGRERIKLCPSARHDSADAVAIGVVTGTVSAPMVAYLEQPVRVADAIAPIGGRVIPTEVVRFAAPCIRSQCLHHIENRCGLAQRTVALVEVAVLGLPRCPIRKECLWFAQEGRQACLRCPAIVTDNYAPSDAIARAARA